MYSIAARYYHITGHADSAFWYASQLLHVENVYGKQKAYRILTQLAIAHQDIPAATIFFPQLLNYTDSIREQNIIKTVGQMYASYNYQLKEAEVKRLQDENTRSKQTTLFFVTAFILALLVFLLFWQHNKHKRHLLQIRLQRVEQLKDEIEKERTESQRKSEQEIAALKKQLDEKDRQPLTDDSSISPNTPLPKRRKDNKIDPTLVTFPIVRTLLKKANSVQGKTSVSPEEWEELHETIARVYPDFFNRLDSLVFPFKKDDMRMNMLIKTGFTPSNIAILLQRPVQSITTIRRRLAERILSSPKASPNIWDEFIISL